MSITVIDKANGMKRLALENVILIKNLKNYRLFSKVDFGLASSGVYICIPANYLCETIIRSALRVLHAYSSNSHYYLRALFNDT